MAVEHAEHVVHHAVEAAEHAGSAIPELPNLVTLLKAYWHDAPATVWLHHWENLLFSLIVALGLSSMAWRYARRPSTIPSGWQNLMELLVEGIDEFVRRVIGPAGRRHTPFIGTLFLYIWLMNLSVLIPGMKSSTSSLNTTVGLALMVFGYVQWIGITAQGPLKYVDHLAGSPRDFIGWLMVPLMLPIHVLGEFVKPLSLSLRLGFNIFAEDVLLAVLVGLGIAAGVVLHLPSGPFTVGIPLQAFVVPLVVIFSTVQALVFSLLTSVYIALMSPSGEHHEGNRRRNDAAGL